MCVDAISRSDDLKESMCVWGFPLQLNGQGSEEQYLHGGAGRIPERARDTIAVRYPG